MDIGRGSEFKVKGSAIPIYSNQTRQKESRFRYMPGMQIKRSGGRYDLVTDDQGRGYEILTELSSNQLLKVLGSAIKQVGSKFNYRVIYYDSDTYKIFIGQGRKTEVMLARNVTTGNMVAAKCIISVGTAGVPRESVQALKKEAILESALCGLDVSYYCSNVNRGGVKFSQLGVTDAYFGSRLLSGSSLPGDDLLKVEKYIAHKLLEQTDSLHQKGVIHYDIKLHNILIDTGLDLKLIDFEYTQSLEEPPKIFDEVRAYSSKTHVAPEIRKGKAESLPGFKRRISRLTRADLIKAESYAVGISILHWCINKDKACTAAQIENEAYSLSSKLKADNSLKTLEENPLYTLIDHLIESDPKKRFTVSEALTYFTNNVSYDEQAVKQCFKVLFKN